VHVDDTRQFLPVLVAERKCKIRSAQCPFHESQRGLGVRCGQERRDLRQYFRVAPRRIVKPGGVDQRNPSTIELERRRDLDRACAGLKA
jgi:hypothetical protein